MTAPFYKDNSGRSHFFPAEWKDFTDYEKEEWDKIFPSSLDRSVERIWDEEMNRWVERPNKTIEEKLGRSGSQPGKPKEERLEEMLDRSDIPTDPVKQKGKPQLEPEEWNDQDEPSQPGEGREQDYSDATIDDAVIRAYTRQIYKLKCEVDSLNRELAAIKSKPTDGWSDEEVVKIMTDFFIWWYNRPGADTKSTAKEWLSDYKAKQLKS